ncbi:MAG: site-specific integrase [Oscillospiraceae bacterium]|nr:site-specific integrase [Oscillospiraceae bacterium]
MTANLYEKNNKYHVMLSWYQNSKRRQKSVSTGLPTQGKNKRKAEAIRKEILAEWETKIACNFQDILLSDYLLQWLEVAKDSIAETTYFSYKKTIKNQICPYFAERKVKLHELRPFHIQDFYAWKKKTSKVTGNTIHRYHANIHKALKHAVQMELIRDNPASKVVLPRKERFQSSFYTAEEMRLLLEVIKGEKIETPVYLASWFGMRRGEVLGLRWQDIDFDSMTLFVKGVITDKGEESRSENIKYRPGAKTRSGLRSFPLPPEVAVYLKERKERQAEYQELFGTAYSDAWLDFVCVNEMGNLIAPEYLSRTFPNVLKKYGLRAIRFHELRDSNASLLLDKGVDMKLIQSWLGHAHYSTTADIYAHLRPDAKRSLGDVLSGEFVEK